MCMRVCVCVCVCVCVLCMCVCVRACAYEGVRTYIDCHKIRSHYVHLNSVSVAQNPPRGGWPNYISNGSHGLTSATLRSI